jgi:adenosylhomocysteine nucleosidase
VLGIVAALQEELAAIVAAAVISQTHDVAGRRFFVGTLHDVAVVMVVCRIGKVAAATTVTILLERFAVQNIVFTGVAGAIATTVVVGDIVVATACVQHDMDARPLFPIHEVPLLGVSRIATDDELSKRLVAAANVFCAAPPAALAELGLTPTLYRGVVASGDQFISSHHAVASLRSQLPDVVAVEMEGAAVAQVCHERSIPFAIIRVISDSADHNAAISFATFLERACGVYALGLMSHFVR